MKGSLHVLRHPAPAGVDPSVHQLILTAIHEKRLLRFKYHGKERIVEPQDYGIQNRTVNLYLSDWRRKRQQSSA
jgi:predicted DNA-binding transcriptional regulator YafY